MIVRDEEYFLRQCLEGVKDFVDEIIIVDTGSKDKTKEIAKEFTDKIYNFQWQDDFAAARNFSLEKAIHDWILVLDADEIIEKKDLKKIREIIKDTKYDAFYLIQRNYGKKSSVKWKKVEKKTKYTKDYEFYLRNPIMRLFRKGTKYCGVVHEVVDNYVKDNDMKSATLEIPIHHYVDEKKGNTLKKRQLRYLKIAEKKLKEEPNGRLYATAAAIIIKFKGDYEKATDYFKKAIGYKYKINECKEGLAECYIALKKFQEAYDLYKELYKQGHLSPSLCNNMANLLVMHKHYEPALRLLKLALAESPDKDRIKKNIIALEETIKKKDKKN